MSIFLSLLRKIFHDFGEADLGYNSWNDDTLFMSLFLPLLRKIFHGFDEAV